MAKKNSVLKTLSRLSLGIVLILVWGFFWIRADILFPVNTDVWRFTYILTFLGLVGFVFAWDTIGPSQTERALFRVSFLKAFPKLIFFSIITLVILFLAGLTIRGSSFITISQAISNVGVSVILVHLFLVATAEELVFRGWLPERLKENQISSKLIPIITAVIFALFHTLLGKSFLTLLTYIPLGLIFYQIKIKYSPKTNMANIGVHFAWNLFVLGFL